jgi:hypothetical protein
MQGSKCLICGREFSNSRALGSHMRYKHGRAGVGGGGSDESLDLKQDFSEILRDVGIKTRAKTVANIFFDMGADSLEKLEEVLRLAGISNPQRALILKRWSQRVGKTVPEELLREKDEGKTEADTIFKAYDMMVQSELRGLLVEDLRTKIEERKRRLKGEDKPERVEELLDEIKSLKASLNFSQQPPNIPYQPYPPPYPSQNIFQRCSRCGYLIPVLKGIPPGSQVLCP